MFIVPLSQQVALAPHQPRPEAPVTAQWISFAQILDSPKKNSPAKTLTGTVLHLTFVPSKKAVNLRVFDVGVLGAAATDAGDAESSDGGSEREDSEGPDGDHPA